VRCISDSLATGNVLIGETENGAPFTYLAIIHIYLHVRGVIAQQSSWFFSRLIDAHIYIHIFRPRSPPVS
jgi:hypothetical protein